MRLTQKERQAIKTIFQEVFQDGEIYLFGSRVDDHAKGGDIDLYIICKPAPDLFDKKIKFLVKLKQAIGDQKIDVIIAHNSKRWIEQEAKEHGVKL